MALIPAPFCESEWIEEAAHQLRTAHDELKGMRAEHAERWATFLATVDLSQVQCQACDAWDDWIARLGAVELRRQSALADLRDLDHGICDEGRAASPTCACEGCALELAVRTAAPLGGRYTGGAPRNALIRAGLSVHNRWLAAELENE